MGEQARGAAFVVQPDEGQSYWQPVPANGYAEVLVSKRNDPSIQDLSAGIQVIAPGSHIREHQHGTEQELLFFFEGTGKVLVNGEEHPVRPAQQRIWRRDCRAANRDLGAGVQAQYRRHEGGSRRDPHRAPA